MFAATAATDADSIIIKLVNVNDKPDDVDFGFYAPNARTPNVYYALSVLE